MAGFKLGNLSPEEFAKRVGTEFTADEIARLKEHWSQKADLMGPEDWHVFDAPTVSVHIGSVTCGAVDVFRAADARRPFNRAVRFSLDERWKEPALAAVEEGEKDA